MTLYYCGCRCGCTTVIADKDNKGCTYCMEDKKHLLDMEIFCGNLEFQFNPLTRIK